MASDEGSGEPHKDAREKAAQQPTAIEGVHDVLDPDGSREQQQRQEPPRQGHGREANAGYQLDRR